MVLKNLIVFICLSSFYISTAQSVDTVDFHYKHFHLKNLHSGQRKYLVYSEDSATQKKSGVYIWERNIALPHHSNEPIVIDQKWFSLDSQLFVRTIHSEVDAHTFLPTLHHTILSAIGRPQHTEHYLFTPQLIYTDSLISNKKFKLAVAHPIFNWELDLETFSILPLQIGKSFVINFYHPGSTILPFYYLYTVEGMTTISRYAQKSIPCYQIRINYPNSHNYSIWWVDVKTHNVIKMKEYFNGKYRYKLLLNA
ncbi:hypothetical protein [Hydrotalea sandarakina]|jgi:hypothetical protein|uniref:Uncharacterized protein n=1 Tax=Hydrotalea sandarakina TaxID=1004304 RepID=A0A2W7SBW4_9BACT|nr:hypothetical protein [Hydrotalea sandarakina]PZX64539.1 hypothetical protein LX80_00735 [Hydrotalea sandarakina]